MKRKSSEPYISTVLHAKGRKLGLPIAGTFELTARCNFNCPMCYVHLSNEQVAQRGCELSAQQWLKIAKDAKDCGMIFALLTGGEPFVRKDFFEIYDGLRKMGLMISINSNGSMLKGEILERILENPPIRFNISLYGGCNDTYQKMCGIPVYDQVKENIRALRKAGIDVNVNLSITQYNHMDLRKIFDDAIDLDVSVKASSYMYPPMRIDESKVGTGNRLPAEEAAAYSVSLDLLRFTPDVFEQRAENMSKFLRQDDEGCPVENGEGIKCRAGMTSFWMTWDGRMLPCGMMTQPCEYPLEAGFEAAWAGIRKAASQIRTPVKCTTCEYKQVCSQCAAVCQAETGCFDGVPDYVCQRTKAIVELTQQAREERMRK